MAMDWNQFQVKISEKDMEALNDLSGQSDGEFEPVPYGIYEVGLDRIELGVSKAGNPTVKGRFRIVNGSYKGQIIFYNQSVYSAKPMFQIKLVNTLLKSMKTDVDLSSQNYVTDGVIDYSKYAQLIEAVAADIKEKGYEFGLEYTENSKGYAQFTISQVFD